VVLQPIHSHSKRGALLVLGCPYTKANPGYSFERENNGIVENKVLIMQERWCNINAKFMRFLLYVNELNP